MRISCLQENLAHGLSVVGRAVATRSVLPITQNVLLRTDKGQLALVGTNLEMSITTSIGAMVEDEGAITVPYRLLADLVSSLPTDRVDLDVPAMDDNPAMPGTVLHIRCGRSATQMNGAAARDFPKVEMVDDGRRIILDAAQLRQGIQMVAFAMATDVSRPVLTGMLVRIKNETLTLATADGFRLSVFTDQVDHPVDDDIEVIIPGDVVRELQRMLSYSTRAQVVLSDTKCMVSLDQTHLVSQLLQGSFPNYEQLIPDRYETRAVVDVDDLKMAVGNAQVFAATGSNIARLEMAATDGDAGDMKVSARSEEVGMTERVFAFDAMDGVDNKIAFNVRYLRDVANALGKGNAALEITNSSSPGLFKRVDSDAYVHVVMPMYVQW